MISLIKSLPKCYQSVSCICVRLSQFRWLEGLLVDQMLGKRLVELHVRSHRLLRFLVNNQLGVTKKDLIRDFHWTPQQLKWLTAEEAKRVHEVAVGAKAGHNEDPEVNTCDTPYYGSPNKGDPVYPQFIYRDHNSERSTYMDRVMTKVLTTFIWYWIFYHLYYDHGMLTGHAYAPYLEEFTDEELGIPPDDAPDPEYWGNHDKPPGTYR